MATEEKLLSHWWMIMSALVHNPPSYVSVHLSLTAAQSAPPVNLLTIAARADLRVPEMEDVMNN